LVARADILPQMFSDAGAAALPVEILQVVCV
jgi:hypothetical protein